MNVEHDPEDVRFGRTAMSLGLVTAEQIRAAIGEQARLLAMGKRLTLAAVLIQVRLLTPDAARRVAESGTGPIPAPPPEKPLLGPDGVFGSAPALPPVAVPSMPAQGGEHAAVPEDVAARARASARLRAAPPGAPRQGSGQARAPAPVAVAVGLLLVAGLVVAYVFHGRAREADEKKRPQGGDTAPVLTEGAASSTPASATSRDMVAVDPEESARVALASVEKWRAEHGDDLAGVVERYRSLAERYPSTQAASYATHAAEGVEERLADSERAAFDDTAAAARSDPATGEAKLRAVADGARFSAPTREKARKAIDDLAAASRAQMGALEERAAREPTDLAFKTVELLRGLAVPPSLVAERADRATRLEARLVKARDDARARALFDDAKREEEELRALVRSGRLDDARARAKGDLAKELARLAAGRDALRSTLVEVEGERVEGFDEATLSVKTKKREVSLAHLAKPPRLSGQEAANAAEFLIARGAGGLASLLLASAGDAGKPLAEKARAAVEAERSREAELELGAVLASNDEKKLRAAAERWKATPAFASRRDAWRDAFVAVRSKALSTSPAGLFHAKAKTVTGGLLSIVYDWKDPASSRDWVADPSDAKSAFKLDTKRGLAEVTGHVRNPARFAGRVKLRAVLAPLSEDAPNVCVVLHDQGGLGGIVVGFGWKPVQMAAVTMPKNARSRGGQTLRAPLDVVVLPDPANAAEPAKWNYIAGEQDDLCARGVKMRLDIVKDDAALVARVNGSSVFELTPAPLPAQLGGVGFAPGPSTLLLHEVSIEAKLDPEWLSTAAADEARAEADELSK